MKVLAIGNSFSEDATAYLHQVAKGADVDINVVNLYIGGCSLETHARNVKENNRTYRYELNGKHTERMASITEVLKEESWDVVTIQQASPFSGILKSYTPYADTLLEEIKKYQPNVKIYFHQTWAYDNNCPHPWFADYKNSMEVMHSAIIKASESFAAARNLEIIPSGRVINEIRKNPLFDYENGGESLCRDTFHMSLIYGRYALAATWFRKLAGKSIFESDFIPGKADVINGYSVPDFIPEPRKFNVIRECVDSLM